MRYILKEIVLVDLCDEDVNDKNTIIDILKKLIENQTDFSIVCSIKSGDPAIAYDRARISVLNDDSFHMKVYKDNSVLSYKNIPLSGIIEIKILTKNSDKYIKPNVDLKNRLRFLDTE